MMGRKFRISTHNCMVSNRKAVLTIQEHNHYWDNENWWILMSFQLLRYYQMFCALFHIVKLCHNWANCFWEKSTWSKCIHFGVLCFDHAGTCILGVFLLWFYKWFSQLTQLKLYVWSSNKTNINAKIID